MCTRVNVQVKGFSVRVLVINVSAMVVISIRVMAVIGIRAMAVVIGIHAMVVISIRAIKLGTLVVVNKQVMEVDG